LSKAAPTKVMKTPTTLTVTWPARDEGAHVNLPNRAHTTEQVAIIIISAEAEQLLGYLEMIVEARLWGGYM